MHPASNQRVSKGQVITNANSTLTDGEEALLDVAEDTKDPDPHQAMRRHATSVKPRARDTNGRPEDLRRHSNTAYTSDREGGLKKPKP